MLLAYYVKGCPILCKGVWQVPTLQQHHATVKRGTYTKERPLAIRPMGIGHSRTLSYWLMAAQVPHRRDWLCHQMGWGQNIGHYHRKNVWNFVWKSIICRLGIPRVFVSDNKKQFDNSTFTDFCSKLGIKNHYSSPTHPQANGQVEVTNWSLLKIIKTQLEGAKGIWPDELPSILWAYRTTARTPTGETPFRLAYGNDVVIPVEIGLTSYRVENYVEKKNEEAIRLQLDLMDEVRATAKQRLTRY